MGIRAECDYCGERFNVQDRFAGEELPCKSCGEYFVVPDPARQRRPRPAARRPMRSSRERDGSVSGPPWAAVGAIVAVVVVGCGLMLWSLASKSGNPAPAANDPAASAASADGSGLFPVASVPLPTFPNELPPPVRRHPSGASIHYVDLKQTPGNGGTPGSQMAMRIYLPTGDHAPRSLGCVLVAPAGSNLLRGNPMDPDDYHDETLPYVNAGFAVVFYSIDGILEDPDNANDFQFARAYNEFKAAHAGVVNGRNALEFALAKLPAVDPERIYCAGHSSAGVLSLLLAQHEPRISGCIAYAPATDVELRLRELTEHPQISNVLRDLKAFLKQSSPKTHASALDCPVFLFHAEDDSNEPIATTRAFAEQLKAEDKNCVFRTTPTGDHYDSMIRPGIPWAIEWLKGLPTEHGKSYPQPAQETPVATNTSPRQPAVRTPQFEPRPFDPPPSFQPPVFNPPSFPPVMPGPGGIQRTMEFDLQSYTGNGDATEAARQVLRRYPWCVADTVQVDFSAKKLIIEVRGGIINSGPVKSGLQRAGFQLGGVAIRTHR